MIRTRQRATKGKSVDDKRELEGRFDLALHRLLERTEDLHLAVMSHADPVKLVSARERRDKAFESLQAMCTGEELTDSPARACLSRIKKLDEEMISLAGTVVGQLRSQRQSLHRRRSAIQAHGKRERGEPLLVTVKA